MTQEARHILASVVICTHNPKAGPFERSLAGLRGQILDICKWELLIIDNQSEPPLEKRIDVSWHPQARIIREEKLGLTPARMRGMAECKAEIIVFADDDNVLSPDYLEQALRIGAAHPELGAWGGSIVAEFATPPPAWAADSLWLLSVREVKERCITSEREPGLLPWGAGLCIRREIAVEYGRQISLDQRRTGLDRRGGSLMSAGDTDLVMTSFDLGLKTGLFPELYLIHHIPTDRVQEKYLLRMAREMAQSLLLLDYYRGGSLRGPSVAGRALACFRHLLKGWKSFRLHQEIQKGRDAALSIIQKQGQVCGQNHPCAS